MPKPTLAAIDAATTIFNLPGYRVLNVVPMPFGRRRIIVESTDLPGCPACGDVTSRRKERHFQRVRDIPVADPVELVWAKRRWFCDELLCTRKSFTEATTQVTRFARSTRRLKEQVVSAVIGSGRAVSETASSFGVS